LCRPSLKTLGDVVGDRNSSAFELVAETTLMNKARSFVNV
jgi:hypothetical protein